MESENPEKGAEAQLPHPPGRRRGSSAPLTWVEERAWRQAGCGSASFYLPGRMGGSCAPQNLALLSFYRSLSLRISESSAFSVKFREKPGAQGRGAGTPDLRAQPMKATFWNWKPSLYHQQGAQVSRHGACQTLGDEKRSQAPVTLTPKTWKSPQSSPYQDLPLFPLGTARV